ncbi:hypothetical protein ACQPW3_16665 [Actinosynnema sp. CA-248983]
MAVTGLTELAGCPVGRLTGLLTGRRETSRGRPVGLLLPTLWETRGLLPEAARLAAEPLLRTGLTWLLAVSTRLVAVRSRLLRGTDITFS